MTFGVKEIATVGDQISYDLSVKLSQRERRRGYIAKVNFLLPKSKSTVAP